MNHWEGVRRIILTDSHLFLMISHDGAHALPRLAFGTPENIRELIEQLHRYYTGDVRDESTH